MRESRPHHHVEPWSFSVRPFLGISWAQIVLDRCIHIRDVHQRRPQSRGDLSSADKGVLQMRKSALFDVKKPRIFRNLWCPHGQVGVKPVRTFFGQEGKGLGSQLFAILCGRISWTAPYYWVTLSFYILTKLDIKRPSLIMYSSVNYLCRFLKRLNVFCSAWNTRIATLQSWAFDET